MNRNIRREELAEGWRLFAADRDQEALAIGQLVSLQHPGWSGAAFAHRLASLAAWHMSNALPESEEARRESLRFTAATHAAAAVGMASASDTVSRSQLVEWQADLAVLHSSLGYVCAALEWADRAVKLAEEILAIYPCDTEAGKAGDRARDVANAVRHAAMTAEAIESVAAEARTGKPLVFH